MRAHFCKLVTKSVTCALTAFAVALILVPLPSGARPEDHAKQVVDMERLNGLWSYNAELTKLKRLGLEKNIVQLSLVELLGFDSHVFSYPSDLERYRIDVEDLINQIPQLTSEAQSALLNVVTHGVDVRLLERADDGRSDERRYFKGRFYRSNDFQEFAISVLYSQPQLTLDSINKLNQMKMSHLDYSARTFGPESHFQSSCSILFAVE